ncbi:hypothetical protein BC941DRAFT_364474, partial [Chlamydoabsidia padenii]
MWINEKLAISSRTNPSFGICCNGGKISFALPRPPPEPMLSLLTCHLSSNETAADFHKYMRAYNTLFAFASMVVQQVNSSGTESTPGVGAYPTTERDQVFRINGTIYHKLGVSNTATGRPTFSQVYFQDAEEQLNQRRSLIDHLNPETIAMLQEIIHNNNCFSRGLMTAYEQYGRERIENVAIVLKSTPALGRRYDLPSYPEISAMVVENSTDGNFHPHDIVINDRSRGIRTLSSLNPSYMPLHYVLMFP